MARYLTKSRLPDRFFGEGFMNLALITTSLLLFYATITP